VTAGVVPIGEEDAARAFSATPLKPGTYVFVDVADTGTGIQPTDLFRIFEPSYSTLIRGRGMGLAVVFGVLRAHGGGVLVTSTPGQGTTFRILLPCLA
jgi:signal transduction histidine kinase